MIPKLKHDLPRVNGEIDTSIPWVKLTVELLTEGSVSPNNPSLFCCDEIENFMQKNNLLYRKLKYSSTQLGINLQYAATTSLKNTTTYQGHR
jgi:hypothetical protein